MLGKIKKSFSGTGGVATASSKLRTAPSAGTTASGVLSGPAQNRDDDSPSVATEMGSAARAGVAPSYRDQPETDYDLGPTQLYTFIESKHWESAAERCRSAPSEAATWISRREPSDPNRIRWRLLPLHATCVFRAPLSLIEALIAANPAAPSLVDDQGMLPIHLACRNGASRGVVMTLLNAHPRSVDAKDKKGRTPLNLVENSASENKGKVVEAIVAFRNGLAGDTLPPAGTGFRAVSPAVDEQGRSMLTGDSPRGAHKSNPALSPAGGAVVGEREVDYENRTMLFRLILKKDWEGVANRCGLFPDEASTWIVTKGFNSSLRFLPLHKACVMSPPPGIIQALVGAFPEAVQRADQDGWLPLHCACFYSAPAAAVEALVRADPKAASKRDDDGRLPLHYACLKGAPEPVVNQLLGAHVKGALAKDNDGRMPLHHACSKAAPDGVIETLVRLGPKAAQSKDNNGRLPLHLACKKGISKHALKDVLLNVYARGAAAKDDQEKLPVHHACQSGACSPAAILALLDAHPESIHARTAFGLTPHDEACQPKQGVNMDPIVEVLDRFKAEQERLGTTNLGGVEVARVRELENRVVELTNRAEVLQYALGDVVHFAAALRADLMSSGKKGDCRAEMVKFCDGLMGLDVGVNVSRQHM